MREYSPAAGRLLPQPFRQAPASSNVGLVAAAAALSLFAPPAVPALCAWPRAAAESSTCSAVRRVLCRSCLSLHVRRISSEHLAESGAGTLQSGLHRTGLDLEHRGDFRQ